MAEPENRTEYEEELALLIVLMWQQMYVAYSAGDDVLPLVNTRRKFEEAVSKVSSDARRQLGSQFDIEMDRVWTQETADRFAREVTDAVIERMRKRFAEQEEARRGGSTSAPPITESDYSEEDASREAVTTVTQTWSASEFDAAEQLSRDGTRTLTAIWKTEPGACKICEPLEGMHKSTWGSRFPKGPPAHPNCRCHLNWVQRAKS